MTVRLQAVLLVARPSSPFPLTARPGCRSHDGGLMSRIVLGVSAEHDSGAVLLIDGKVAAGVNEERLTRQKLFTGYPERSIERVLEIGGVQRQEIDEIAVST